MPLRKMECNSASGCSRATHPGRSFDLRLPVGDPGIRGLPITRPTRPGHEALKGDGQNCCPSAIFDRLSDLVTVARDRPVSGSLSPEKKLAMTDTDAMKEAQSRSMVR